MELKYPLTHYVYRRFSIPVARLLVHTPLTPNMITILATLLGFYAAYLIAVQSTVAGVLVLLVSQILDCADGDLARISGRVTRRGAYLDRVLDRFVDAALIIALIALNPQEYWLVGTLAVVGTFMVSVTRIMAEAVGAECKVGIATRDFRILAIVVGVLLGQVYLLLSFLALLGFLTALHRMAYSMKQM
ncbi:MAG: CDP-alcohol phosphatidyltransferase family protein [Euryarchaeota archaeon]|nr:CDP-alcohol phosphatidyltransferase family protein [Euryarchaeota archaeon]